MQLSQAAECNALFAAAKRERSENDKTHWTPLGRYRNDYLLFTLSDISWIECRNDAHYSLLTILEPKIMTIKSFHTSSYWTSKTSYTANPAGCGLHQQCCFLQTSSLIMICPEETASLKPKCWAVGQLLGWPQASEPTSQFVLRLWACSN